MHVDTGAAFMAFASSTLTQGTGGNAVRAHDLVSCMVKPPMRLHVSLWVRAMAESNAVRTRRPTLRRQTAAAAERIYWEKFGAEDGSVPATFEARASAALLIE